MENYTIIVYIKGETRPERFKAKEKPKLDFTKDAWVFKSEDGVSAITTIIPTSNISKVIQTEVLEG